MCFLGDVVSCVLVSVIYIIFVFFLGGGKNMVQRVMDEDRLRKVQSLPRFSYGHGMVRKDGAPNRYGAA